MIFIWHTCAAMLWPWWHTIAARVVFCYSRLGVVPVLAKTRCARVVDPKEAGQVRKATNPSRTIQLRFVYRETAHWFRHSLILYDIRVLHTWLSLFTEIAEIHTQFLSFCDDKIVHTCSDKTAGSWGTEIFMSYTYNKNSHFIFVPSNSLLRCSVEDITVTWKWPWWWLALFLVLPTRAQQRREMWDFTKNTNLILMWSQAFGLNCYRQIELIHRGSHTVYIYSTKHETLS